MRTEDYTENHAAHYRLPKVSTMEKLSMLVSAGEGAVLVTEFVETTDEINGGECKCRLNLTAYPDELFIDGRHAIAWALATSSPL